MLKWVHVVSVLWPPLHGLAFWRGTHELFSCSFDRTVKLWEMAYVETLQVSIEESEPCIVDWLIYQPSGLYKSTTKIEHVANTGMVQQFIFTDFFINNGSFYLQIPKTREVTLVAVLQKSWRDGGEGFVLVSEISCIRQPEKSGDQGHSTQIALYITATLSVFLSKFLSIPTPILFLLLLLLFSFPSLFVLLSYSLPCLPLVTGTVHLPLIGNGQWQLAWMITPWDCGKW